MMLTVRREFDDIGVSSDHVSTVLISTNKLIGRASERADFEATVVTGIDQREGFI